MDYDKTKMPASYDAGRSLSPASLALWLGVIARAVPDPCKRIVDLGCGTGRFSRPIAEHLDADVVALDPSDAMLAEARQKSHPRVSYERAAGEALPLADASVDMVFMSMVFHHFKDRERVLAECCRVLRPGGRIAMRAGTNDDIAQYAYTRFFPATVPLIRAAMLSCAAIFETFAGAGFRTVRHETVSSPLADNWAHYADRLAHRADSMLVQIGDEDFTEGLAAMRRHAATMPPAPVAEPVEFFIFEKPLAA